MAPTLGYWNCRGRGHHIRLLLTYTGTEFEDKHYSLDNYIEWLNKTKFSIGLDFPNLPYYIDGSEKLTQSVTILRHIARQHKLDGQTEEEKLRIDLVEQQLYDMSEEMVMMVYDPNFEKLKADHLKKLETTLPLLAKFLGNRAFLAGDSVTYVDFMAYEYLDKISEFAPQLFAKEDNLKRYKDRVSSLPRVANYIKTVPKLPYSAPMAKWGGSV